MQRFSGGDTTPTSFIEQEDHYDAGRVVHADAEIVDPKLCSAIEFTERELLHTEYDEYDAKDIEKDEGNVEARNRDREDEVSAPQNWTRTSFWIVSSSVAVFSSKQLMLNHGYHYPLTVAFRSFVVASITYFIVHLGTAPSNTNGSKARWGIYRPRREDFWPNSRWLPMIPAALVAAFVLPMFLEGLLHMPSLPVLVMLFPLAYVIESLLLFISCSLIRSGRWLPWETIVATIALSVILFDEYRLNVQGLIWGTCGIIAIGVARGFFAIASEITGPEWDSEAKMKAYHGFAFMTLVFGTISSGLLAHSKEFKRDPILQQVPFTSSTLVLTLINTVSIVGTMFSGTSIFAYSPISFEDASVGFSNMPLSITDLLASTTSSLLVLMAAICLGSTVFVSWLQIAAYVLAIACLAGSKSLHLAIVNIMDLAQRRIHVSGILGPYMGLRELRKPSRLFTSGILFLLTASISYILYDIVSFPLSELSTIKPSLDLSYVPATRFEIVISMYEESPTAVASLITSLLSTTYLSSLERSTIKTIIYTKSSDADLDTLKNLTRADIVLRLPNVGREGGTYLHHIVNNWDTLAEQTMFIQAGVHNKRELMPRIEKYLVGETGMLSLGESGVVCDCTGCGDRWGWQDSWGVIPSLYSKIYQRTCEADTQILLSYKGQFIASARRIRGIRWDIYDNLMKTIESREGWSHDKTVLGDLTDSPDNPFFGFTVERAWGLLMQCADENVAAKCPSLLSGTLGLRRGGDVEDCGCVDWTRGAL